MSKYAGEVRRTLETREVVVRRIIFNGLIALLGACSESTGPSINTPLPAGLIVSNPIPARVMASASAVAASPSTGDSVAYVAMTPGTVPTGIRATVRRLGSDNTLTTELIEGGFDPVPVAASEGDSIEVVITDARGAEVQRAHLVVAASRQPIVVRTDPPPKKRDHPLNAAIVVVFSEPVAGSTVTTSSVQVFRGTTPIAGAASVLQGATAAAVFNPTVPLEPNTDYRLVVSPSVKGLSGEALAAGVTVEFTTGTALAGPVNAVVIAPDTSAVLVASQLQLVAMPRDSFGTAVVGRPVVWSSEDPAVATVSATGVVTALAEGVAHIHGTVDFYQGVATVLVSTSLAPVDTVVLSTESATVPIGSGGGSVRLAAVLKDGAGNVLQFRSVSWRSDNPSLATVTPSSAARAWVMGVAAGSTTITATSEGKSARAIITFVTPGTYERLAAGSGHTYGGSHTCGVTTDNWLLCWGGNDLGQLGTGAPDFGYLPTGLGGMQFSEISTSSPFRTCALTPQGAAYCWGGGRFGVLGTGSASAPEGCGVYLAEPCSQAPVAVAGGLRFAAIGLGQDYVCALTLTGAAYCWGLNDDGALGTGSRSGPENCDAYGSLYPCSTRPYPVIGGLAFTALAVGGWHTCGLTASGEAYCWGQNNHGELGDSTTVTRLSPVRVAGGHTFVALSSGAYHTCGITSDSSAYCWGDNEAGQLGDGTNTGPEGCPYWSPPLPCSLTPVAVAGALHFTTINVGQSHTCALTSDGTAYCWGANWSGQLGDGTTTNQMTPTPVAGGLTFASLNAGGLHTCGVTTGGIAYCWGDNYRGELGDGTTTNSTGPVKVLGQP